MKKGDKVEWVDGIGFEHEGVVDRDTDSNEFMIPVRTNDDRILRIRYLDLTLIEMEYTKGEWLIQDFGDETIEVYVPKVGMVAKCNRRTNEQAEANAHLIAAAPDMYEALEEILAHVEDDDIQRVGGQCTLCHTYRMKGHEALAKAEEK